MLADLEFHKGKNDNIVKLLDDPVSLNEHFPEIC
jgi:hypothetical protein